MATSLAPGSYLVNLTMKRPAVIVALVFMMTATTQPADAFLFGVLGRFFQPFPVVGIRTYATPTQIGTAYINKFPFNTPPARKPPSSHRAGFSTNACIPAEM